LGGFLDCVPSGTEKQKKLLADIQTFVSGTRGLRCNEIDLDRMRIHQNIDGKTVTLEASLLDDVLIRSDASGEEFLQVNFSSGLKILLTGALIGFRPTAPKGLDVSRLPRVVTTPDILNVFDAIQEALHASGTDMHEISVLKKIYEAVIAGGEAVGIDLSRERSWLSRIPASLTKISA
jgi:hypothetical protein